LTPTSDRRQVGVFGGTFDPIHRGHVEVAEECAVKLGLDPVLMIPSNRPPHRDPPLASAEDRLAMVRLAVASHDRLFASDIELRRGGVSYSVDTIRELAAEYPNAALTLLLGWDAAAEFRDWHGAEEIARLARIAVFNRSATPTPSGITLQDMGLPPNAVRLEVDSPPVSSTSVRQMLAHEGSGSGDLPAPVALFINHHNLYRDDNAAVS
jgi:nicotinate-nucleotide adenylyltransferase